MRRVERSEILDSKTYEAEREKIRERALAEMAFRRVRLGSHLNFLFESTETIRFQIQEWIRSEGIVRESEIVHELNTFNEILGEPGELGCTLLIEIDQPKEREKKLKEWKNLPEHIYLELENGEKTYALHDRRQVQEDKLSSVQYLLFKCPSPPVRIGSDLPEITKVVSLDEEQREVLKIDLESQE